MARKRRAKTVVAVIAFLVVAPLVAAYSQDGERQEAEPETFGAEANPTGDPLGGGTSYRRTIAAGDFTVTTASSLLAALRSAKSGQVVYVEDAAEIDLTGQQSIVIPGGVTVASGRGADESEGALLFTTEDRATPEKPERFSLFATGGPGVRITGLRLRGPDDQRRGRYEFLNSDGILAQHDKLEVDNCEIWAWSHGGVYLRRGEGGHVHHNSIHHCQRSGLGYGVVLDVAEVLIEANVFDWCRHAIAATGRPGSGYEARYNLVLANANGHSFDMHGGRDRKDGTDVAGDWMKIHHNTFKATRVYAIVIRGKPRELAEIHHNRFLHADAGHAFRQSNARGNLQLDRNRYGESR